jgi:methionyl-tRNA formyltransferase
MGTPEFAVASLRSLADSDHEIVGVITSTDKLGGRGGRQVLESAVKRFARERGFQILQPPNLKNPEFVRSLEALKADLQVVVAFRMLPEVVWDMPPMGTINLHGSLLPAYRGAAPINWAIINGELQTGVTTFKLKHEIDTGNILIQRHLEINSNDTAGDVHDKMMELGAQAVLDTVNGLEAGTPEELPQSDTEVSQAPKLYHDMCEIQFDRPVEEVHNFIRGLSPFPTAWTTLDGIQLNVYRSEIVDKSSNGVPAGIVANKDLQLEISCKPGTIRLLEVQLAGKRRMRASDFLNGYQIKSKILGSST